MRRRADSVAPPAGCTLVEGLDWLLNRGCDLDELNDWWEANEDFAGEPDPRVAA